MTEHVCPLPRVNRDDHIDGEEVLWHCDCGRRYRMNPIVWRWFRYYARVES